MNELILIRGLPGSGKSTMAKTEYPDHIHREADQYFVDKYGNYNFDATKLHVAHKKCINSTRAYLKSGYDVVVSNTFTTWEEMKPYLRLGFPTTIVIATGDYKSVHNVPDEVIQLMRDRWED